MINNLVEMRLNCIFLLLFNSSGVIGGGGGETKVSRRGLYKERKMS